nr:AraC family transcriptional regulator [uncultured Roseateles sp.]
MKETQASAAVQGRFGRVATHTTSRPLVEHAHFEFNFIFWVGGSTTGFRVGKQDCVLDPSSAILVNPWLPHAKLPSADGPTLVLTVLPDPHWLAQLLDLEDMPLVKLFSQPCVALTPEVRALIDRLAATMNAGAAFGDSAYEPMVSKLVLALVNTYADADMRTTFFRRDRPMDARISRSLPLIREAAASNPNLDDIASQVGLSRSRFFEQFKACIGASPQQYLDWARMAVATKLLASTEQSVADVSHELGFSAPSHFARFFAQHMGVPPSDFKRGVITENETAA